MWLSDDLLDRVKQRVRDKLQREVPELDAINRLHIDVDEEGIRDQVASGKSVQEVAAEMEQNLVEVLESMITGDDLELMKFNDSHINHDNSN